MNRNIVLQSILSIISLSFLRADSLEERFREFGIKSAKNLAESLESTAQQIYTKATEKPKIPRPVHPYDRFFLDTYAGIRAPIPPGAINMLRTVKFTKTSFNGTPLMAALRGRYVHVMEYLLANGADPNIQNEHGLTALHLAARDGYTAAVHVLLDAGANSNIVDKAGMTPLMYAVLKNKNNDHLETIKLLIAYGAQVGTVNNQGKTALSYAQAKHDDTVIKLLKSDSIECIYDEEGEEYICAFGVPADF